MKLPNYKRYEIVKNTDDHFKSFRFINDKIIEEFLYELDVVYFGFWRTGWYLEERKLDLEAIMKGFITRRRIHRGVLNEFIKNVYSMNWIYIHLGFTAMYKRETFLIFYSREELREKFPEYFI